MATKSIISPNLFFSWHCAYRLACWVWRFCLEGCQSSAFKDYFIFEMHRIAGLGIQDMAIGQPIHLLIWLALLVFWLYDVLIKLQNLHVIPNYLNRIGSNRDENEIY